LCIRELFSYKNIFSKKCVVYYNGFFCVFIESLKMAACVAVIGKDASIHDVF